MGLDDPCTQAVVDVQNALYLRRTVRVNDKQAGDLALHYVDRLGGKRVWPDCARVGCHDIASFHLKEPVHMAAQIAVGDNPTKVALGIGYANHAKALLADHQQGVAHGACRGYQGNAFAAVHEVADLCELCAQFAARMEVAEVFRGEFAVLHHGNCQCIAQRERHGRRDGRHNARATCLAQLRQQDRDV